ncbi:MAG: hypothetical protein ACRDV1_01460 [Actinomycetes bacterium]
MTEDQFPLTDTERTMVCRVEAELHSGRWAPHTTLEHNLWCWGLLVEEVNDYDGIKEDYDHDLSARNFIAEFLDRCPEPLRSRVAARAESIDIRFRASTREDESGLLLGAVDDEPWWMRRVPLRGPLLDELEQDRQDRARENEKWARWARDMP